jgi:hypothetical protein
VAGGSLTITVPTYAMLQSVAQRVQCWAGGVANRDNNNKIRILSTTPQPSIWIPEELFSIGALALEPSGADLLSGYVAGTNITFAANNGTVAFKDPNTCAADNAQSPTISTITMNVGGNPLAITLNYANFAGNGTVNITWGDGTSTNGAAESGASNHTYPYRPGTFTIRVTDASVTTVWTEQQIFVP